MEKYTSGLQRSLQSFNTIPREYFIYAFFGILFIMIVSELFGFTVMNHEYYKNLADKQQISTQKEPVSRGNIYFSNEVGKILATSVYLNDLAIDPSIEGDKEKLKEFLTEIVYHEICYLKSSNECKSSLNRFLGVLDLPDFRNNELYLKTKIAEKIQEKIYRTKLTSVLLYETLTSEQIFLLQRLNLSGVYINAPNLYVNPEEVKDEVGTAEKLYSVIGGEKEIIKNKIKKRNLRYVLILNKLSISSSEMVKNKINEEKQAQKRGFITEKEMITKSIILSPNHQRFYPENGLASQVVGFVNNEKGNYGIEGYYDQILKGTPSENFLKKDIQGRLIDPYSFTKEKTSLAGADITLTIDRNIQKAVEDILDEDIVAYQANTINVVVMDPKSGAILAMAGAPRFNPNRPGDVFELVRVTPSKYPNPKVNLRGMRVLAVDNKNGSEYVYNGRKIFLRELAYEDFDDPTLEKYVFENGQGAGVYKNHMIQDIYEPGSIFKPILMAAGIDSGEISKNDMYQDNGYIKIDNYTIKNVVHQCLGYHSFSHAMDYSCNVGMIRIAQKLGKIVYHKYLDLFGFGKKTGITLGGEVSGRLDPPEKWSQAQLLTTSYGLGIGVTMIQMASAYSVLANGGIYYKPQIVKSIETADGKKTVFKKEASHRVIKETTSKDMIQVLISGVENAEAKSGKIEGYTIAGKTGTAQIAYKGRYDTGQGATMASFAGFGPAEDPKFVIIVRVERPRASEWGGATAGKTFNKIAKYMLNYYKIPPKQAK